MIQFRTVIAVCLISICFVSQAFTHETPKIDSAYSRGIELIESGNPLIALPFFEKVESLKPGYKSVHEYLIKAYKFVGIEHYTQDRTEEAIEVLKKALQLDPENTEIQNYIDHCMGELEAIRKLQGEPELIAETPAEPETIPPGPAPSKPITEAAPITPSKPAISSPTTASSVKTPAISQSEPEIAMIKSRSNVAFSSGLAAGLAFPSGDNFDGQKRDWLFSGNMSIYSSLSTLGGRIDVIYGHLNHDVTGYENPGFERYLSIFGASLSATGQITPIPKHSLSIMAGIGLFEITRQDYNNLLAEGYFNKETKPGYIIGAGLRRKLGGLSATVEARYLILENSMAPNTLQLMFGLGLN